MLRKIILKKLSKFNERLSELMEAKPIKSEALAAEIGVTGAVIRRWTYNDTNVQLKNLIKLADYFGCSVDFLTGRSDKVLDFTPKKRPNFYARLIQVLKTNFISTYKIFKNTKIKGYYLQNWKNGADPKLSSLIELVDYLDCTIDYLIGRE